MECNDLLTCGECRLVFSLRDIVSFIRHKQSTCRGGLQEPNHSDEENVEHDDDDDDADRSCVNGPEPAVMCTTDEDDRTVLCRNGVDMTISDSHQDEHPSRPGSTSM